MKQERYLILVVVAFVTALVVLSFRTKNSPIQTWTSTLPVETVVGSIGSRDPIQLGYQDGVWLARYDTRWFAIPENIWNECHAFGAFMPDENN